MDIQISIQNPQKAIALLEFLKSFEIVDDFKILVNNSSELYVVEPESDLSIVKKQYS